MATRRRGRQLGVEDLERRCTPATFGLPWGDARHLTLSFVPDGTAIVNHSSNLFATLDAQRPSTIWQRDILRAFQTWAVRANINIGLKPDGGQPIGVGGKGQHDARFGDVRVAAHPMAPEVLAISVPGGSTMVGTWGGDVFLNSDPFSGSNAPDLFSVALHEAGHVFGLGDNGDPTSPMSSFLSDASAPNDSDTAALRALFGSRAPDGYEGSGGNDTFAHAAAFPIPGGYDGDRPLVLFADRTTSTDVDVYRISPPSDATGPMTIRLQSAGLSLLAPHLVVADSTGKVLGEAAASGGFGDSVAVHLPTIVKGEEYFLRVDSEAVDVFGIGGYGLCVSFDSTSQTDPALLNRVLSGEFGTPGPEEAHAILGQEARGFLNDDHHRDDGVAEAVPLVTAAGYAENAHYEVVGSLSDGTDVDFYRVRSVKPLTGPVGVMTITLRTLDEGGAVPAVLVLGGDDATVPIPLRVLVNGNGIYTVEALGIAANDSYYLRVSSDPSSAMTTGNYEATVDFPAKSAELTRFAAGSIDATATGDFDLYVAQSQLFHLLLTAGDAPSPAARVHMSVRDESGHQVAAIVAGAGRTVSGDALFLTPGAYSIRFLVEGTVGPVEFSLTGQSISDPVGPALRDPTLKPIYPGPGAPTVPPIYAYPGGVISTSPVLIVSVTPGKSGPTSPVPPVPSKPGTPPAPVSQPTPSPSRSPSATSAAIASRSRRGVTSINIAFDTDMAQTSVTRPSLYQVQRGVMRRGRLVFTALLRVRSLTYNAESRTATIQLARPFKGPIQVTIAAIARSEDGRSSSGPAILRVV